MAKNPTKFTKRRRELYLAAYELTGELSAAAVTAGVSRQTIYHNMKTDPDFRDAVDVADGKLYAVMLEQVRKLAIDGVEKTTYDKDGNVVAVTRIYSQPMLLAWLKRRRREDWGDQVKVEQKVETTHRVVVANEIPRGVREDLRNALAGLPKTTDVNEN